jgi:hypothetical protein
LPRIVNKGVVDYWNGVFIIHVFIILAFLSKVILPVTRYPIFPVPVMLSLQYSSMLMVSEENYIRNKVHVMRISQYKLKEGNNNVWLACSIGNSNAFGKCSN